MSYTYVQNHDLQDLMKAYIVGDDYDRLYITGIGTKDTAEQIQKLLFCLGFRWPVGQTVRNVANIVGDSYWIALRPDKILKLGTVLTHPTTMVVEAEDIFQLVEEEFPTFDRDTFTIKINNLDLAQRVQHRLYQLGFKWHCGEHSNLIHLNEFAKGDSGILLEPDMKLAFTSVEPSGVRFEPTSRKRYVIFPKSEEQAQEVMDHLESHWDVESKGISAKTAHRMGLVVQENTLYYDPYTYDPATLVEPETLLDLDPAFPRWIPKVEWDRKMPEPQPQPAPLLDKDYTVKLSTVEEYELLQRTMFRHGWAWNSGDTEPMYLDRFTPGDKISICSDKRLFSGGLSNPTETITFTEFMELIGEIPEPHCVSFTVSGVSESDTIITRKFSGNYQTLLLLDDLKRARHGDLAADEFIERYHIQIKEALS